MSLVPALVLGASIGLGLGAVLRALADRRRRRPWWRADVPADRAHDRARARALPFPPSGAPGPGRDH